MSNIENNLNRLTKKLKLVLIFQKVENVNEKGGNLAIAVNRDYMTIDDIDSGCKSILKEWKGVIDLHHEEVIERLDKVIKMLDNLL